ncbi:FtsX-like permease family protein [Heyndrickxia sporothermodurans]
MSINFLIFRNMKKNIKNYYLYVFALIFSVALFFTFVTLKYDPSLDEIEGTMKGAAAIRAASILLIAIVAIFLLYANSIFIKRRSKEIGLFQLIGLTKTKIVFILSAENFMLYFSSLWVGIFVGFSFSKFFIMILFKTVGVKSIAALHFSNQALLQTLIVFGAIYLLILFMNYIFIKRQSILSLFRVKSSTEEKVKKISLLQMIIGILGIILILFGYYVSSILFSGTFPSMIKLFLAMTLILGTVIVGTYLFYKGSVSFLSNIIRKRKDGYLNIREVLSLSTIMFRMQSNALLLTIITTVSALAIGLLSLSYISYYSAEKSASQNVASDFALTNKKDAEKFEGVLYEQGIKYDKKIVEVIQTKVNIKQIANKDLSDFTKETDWITLPVVSDESVEGIDLPSNQTIFTGYNDFQQKFMSLKHSGNIQMEGKHKNISLTYSGLRKDYIISYHFTDLGLPVAIVDKTVFERLKKDIDPIIQKKSSVYFGINIVNQEQLKEANVLFSKANYPNSQAASRVDMSDNQKKNMGLVLFIVSFLGLTFLITSGCILYFKQMDESEDERANFTILRKLGFTQRDLIQGIQLKQIYNFGIPLLIGLFHSYFAVQSGWFLFGTEIWTPMIIVMIIYTALYSIFGILSVFFYKKVIQSAL